MSIERAIKAVQSGSPIIILDDRREFEGDLFCLADKVEMEVLQFMIRRCSGFLCMAMPRQRLEEIGIPRFSDVFECMVAAIDGCEWEYDIGWEGSKPVTKFTQGLKPSTTPFHFPVDLKGLASGISAADRYATIKALIQPEASIEQFECPGHLPLLGSHPAGLKGRVGHTESAVALAVIAGGTPAGLLCEICDDDGTMTHGEGLQQFADEYGLEMLSISELLEFLHLSSVLPIATL